MNILYARIKSLTKRDINKIKWHFVFTSHLTIDYEKTDTTILASDAFLTLFDFLSIFLVVHVFISDGSGWMYIFCWTDTLQN